MRHILICCLTLILLYSCKKEDGTGARVDIYMLKSFTTSINPISNLPVLSISNAVLADTPLIADKDIAFYTIATTTFKLRNDIKPVIKNYGADKAFAITVNSQPVYFGKFHPGYLSSMTVGVATIDPILYTNNELEMKFVLVNGNTDLQKLDKRNDSQIINALKAAGKIR